MATKKKKKKCEHTHTINSDTVLQVGDVHMNEDGTVKLVIDVTCSCGASGSGTLDEMDIEWG